MFNVADMLWSVPESKIGPLKKKEKKEKKIYPIFSNVFKDECSLCVEGWKHL
jgi:hypothetical protein